MCMIKKVSQDGVTVDLSSTESAALFKLLGAMSYQRETDITNGRWTADESEAVYNFYCKLEDARDN